MGWSSLLLVALPVVGWLTAPGEATRTMATDGRGRGDAVVVDVDCGAATPATLRVRARGIEPVGVDVACPTGNDSRLHGAARWWAGVVALVTACGLYLGIRPTVVVISVVRLTARFPRQT